MADKYAVNYAKLVATPQPSAIPPDYRGRQRPIYDEYTVVAGDVVNDRVFVGYLEPGDKVIDGYIDTDALGGTATLILGDSGAGAIAADTDRYFASFSAAAATKSRALAATGVGFKNTTLSRIPVFLTFGGSNPTVGAKIRTCLQVVGD